MRMVLNEEELKSAVYNREQRIEHLEAQYKELEVEYKHIVERLTEAAL